MPRAQASTDFVLRAARARAVGARESAPEEDTGRKIFFQPTHHSKLTESNSGHCNYCCCSTRTLFLFLNFLGLSLTPVSSSGAPCLSGTALSLKPDSGAHGSLDGASQASFYFIHIFQ
jgi:hypothetical protein